VINAVAITILPNFQESIVFPVSFRKTIAL